MNMVEAINFVSLSSHQIEEVLFWRNHPIIQKYMRNDKEILLSEHLRFIENLSKDPSKRYFYVHENHLGVGTFNLTHIENDSAEMGIYVNPFMHGKGYGKKILDYIVNYATVELNLKTLYLEVYRDNPVAIHLYEKNKFYKYDATEDMFKMKRDLK